MSLIETKNLKFSYGRTPVLRDINFKLEEEQIWAFIGPNGSGKSTLLRCLSGLLYPHGGQVLLQGTEINHIKRKQLARQICFLPQTQADLHFMRVYDLVALGRSPYQSLGWYLSSADREKVSWALEYMELAHLRHLPLASLSGGERQRAWIAMILAQDTRIVLLDEPTTFLDIKFQWHLMEKIQDIRTELHKSFIVVLHDVNQALALADQVLVLKNGRVYKKGNPAQIITTELLHDVYDIQANVCVVSANRQRVVIPALAVK